MTVGSSNASPRDVGRPTPPDMVSTVLRMSILQSGAPDVMRGRMRGVFIVVVAGGPRLGDLRAGAMATAVSVPATMVTGGLFIVLGMVVVAIVVPTFRRYRFDDRDPESPSPAD